MKVQGLKSPTHFLYYLFLIVLAVSFRLSAFGSAASADSLVDELVSSIEQQAAAIKDIKGSFSQESYLIDLERTEMYKGDFFIKKPSQVRWRYAEPRDEEVYIRTEVIWIHKRIAKQAIKSIFSENAYAQAPIALLGSLENLNADFIITAADQKDTLHLKPKRKIGSIKEILLEINDGNFPVRSFKIFDLYGNNVTITVNDVKTNTGLDDTVFTFTPTQEMEIFEY
jgi:outer membrane lipoprotein carrier protein